MEKFDHPSHQGRVVLITGGSRGFGWLIAEKLLQCGAKVALTASTKGAQLESVQAQAEKISGDGNCITIHADVREWSDCQRTVTETIRAFGKIDVLINNAGRGSREYTIDRTSNNSTKFWDVPINAWRNVIDTNLCQLIKH